MSTPKEFRFQVDPSEGPDARDARWDTELDGLASLGLTIQGVGPDGDYPIRYDFDSDGSLTFDEWWKGNPDTPWFEVYNLVPLPYTKDDIDLAAGLIDVARQEWIAVHTNDSLDVRYARKILDELAPTIIARAKAEALREAADVISTSAKGSPKFLQPEVYLRGRAAEIEVSV